MTSSFPRLLAAWLDVRVANRKKVRWQSIATHESGGLSPFRGHSSALNASVQFTRAGAFDKRDVRESRLSRLPHRRRERAHSRVSPCRRLAQKGADCRRQSPDAGDKKFQRCLVAPNYLASVRHTEASSTIRPVWPAGISRRATAQGEVPVTPRRLYLGAEHWAAPRRRPSCLRRRTNGAGRGPITRHPERKMPACLPPPRSPSQSGSTVNSMAVG